MRDTRLTPLVISKAHTKQLKLPCIVNYFGVCVATSDISSLLIIHMTFGLTFASYDDMSWHSFAYVVKVNICHRKLE